MRRLDPRRTNIFGKNRQNFKRKCKWKQLLDCRWNCYRGLKRQMARCKTLHNGIPFRKTLPKENAGVTPEVESCEIVKKIYAVEAGTQFLTQNCFRAAVKSFKNFEILATGASSQYSVSCDLEGKPKESFMETKLFKPSEKRKQWCKQLSWLRKVTILSRISVPITSPILRLRKTFLSVVCKQTVCNESIKSIQVWPIAKRFSIDSQLKTPKLKWVNMLRLNTKQFQKQNILILHNLITLGQPAMPREGMYVREKKWHCPYNWQML